MDSRDFFDLLIYAVILVGLILAARRFYQDMTRPLPVEDESPRQPIVIEPTKNAQKPAKRKRKRG